MRPLEATIGGCNLIVIATMLLVACVLVRRLTCLPCRADVFGAPGARSARTWVRMVVACLLSALAVATAVGFQEMLNWSVVWVFR